MFWVVLSSIARNPIQGSKVCFYFCSPVHLNLQHEDNFTNEIYSSGLWGEQKWKINYETRSSPNTFYSFLRFLSPWWWCCDISNISQKSSSNYNVNSRILAVELDPKITWSFSQAISCISMILRSVSWSEDKYTRCQSCVSNQTRLSP